MVKYISPVKTLFVAKTSWRHLQDMSSRRLQDDFSVTIFCLPRRLQDVFKRYLQDVFKMFSRCLQDVLEDEKLLRWRPVEDVFKACLEDVLKTNKCLLGSRRELFLENSCSWKYLFTFPDALFPQGFLQQLYFYCLQLYWKLRRFTDSFLTEIIPSRGVSHSIAVMEICSSK